MAVDTARARRTVDEVTRACARAETADELLAGVADAVHRAVPHDAATWFGVDPVTLLATAPSRVENLDAALCETYWHLEFHEQDTGLFADLARGEGAGALRLSLDDRPARSIRYREFMRPQGYDDELRAVFRAGDSTWGVVGLYREGAGHPFDEGDLAIVKSISTVVGAALRDHVRRTSPWLGQPSAPGLLMVDADMRVVSSNAEAEHWLRELLPGENDALDLPDAVLQVPTILCALVSRARAVAEGCERSAARLRLRDRRGRWLVLHASCLSGPGTSGDVAIVIEAAKSAEIAPIIIEAYSLSPRERDVLGAIARGASTAEIAAALFISQHTVRDYVKTVFEKLGVSSRSELVARLFGEHYDDRLHSTMVHLH
jgi:DNA-binding CsgD family transcriptional regulator